MWILLLSVGTVASWESGLISFGSRKVINSSILKIIFMVFIECDCKLDLTYKMGDSEQVVLLMDF